MWIYFSSSLKEPGVFTVSAGSRSAYSNCRTIVVFGEKRFKTEEVPSVSVEVKKKYLGF